VAATGTAAAGAGAPASLAQAAQDTVAARTADAADGAGKVISGAAATAAVDAATSTPNAAAGGATKGTNTGASASPGAAAQTVNVAAAAAPGAVAAAAGTVDDSDGTDSSASADDSPAPAGPTPEAPATALAAMAVPVPVASPAAVASAQTASAVANIGSVGKASHSGAGDSSVPDSGGGAAGVAQLNSGTTTATDPAPTPTLKVSQPVDTPEFSQGLADGVSMMVGNNLTSAKLQVNPAQLGPIDVRITVQGNQAQVSLTAHSAVTRDALESSSSKLREMLGAQGFAQVNVDISQRSFQERSTYAQPYDWTPSANGSAASASVDAVSSSRASSSLLDAYA
jgi:flagellar hook-length control protein FliK